MKTKKYALIVLSILMILLVFASSASAADANATDVLSVDESTSINNEKLALDYSLDNAVANDTNAVENEEILQNPNSDDDILGTVQYSFPSEITVGEQFSFSFKSGDDVRGVVLDFYDTSQTFDTTNPNEGTFYYTYNGDKRGSSPVLLTFKKLGDMEIYDFDVTINDPVPPTDTWYVNASAPGGGDGKSSADAFKTLKEALTNSELQDGNTIMIASGEYKGENNTGLEITKNLNFVKYGDSEAIFDAENLGQIWKFTEKSANITGLTFRNGKTDDKNGGAIYFDNSGGNVVNCTFTGNTASDYAGGAIYMKSGNVTNCTFTDNNAQSGGAIYIGSGNVTNCTFKNNTANNGGAIGSSSSVIIEYCTFTDNTAKTGEGGAIYLYGSGNVNNCNFTGNTAQNDNGGAIYMKSGNVNNCTFTDNTAQSNHGGAIYLYGSGNVNNCTFTNNTAYNGGAIYIGSGNVTNCTFTDNNATNKGGAIYIYYGGDINNCTFTNNTAQTGEGGAIYINNGGNVNNCNFTGNNAKSKYEGGGAIYINNDGNVNNCNFTGNNGPRHGGAIYFTTYGDVTNCTFTDNKATFMGGAIHFKQQGSVSYCTFTDNNGTSWGGAIAFNGNGNVTNCAFVNNSAKYRNAISCNDPLKSAENNWWGSNNPDWKNLIYEKIPSVYAVLNITADPSEISNDKTSEIATKFVWNGTDTNATSLLPKRNIKLSSNGNLTETEGYVGLTSQFSAADGGIYYVNATVDNEMLGVNIVKIPIPTNINVTITSLNLTVEETSLINATLNPSEAGNLTVDYDKKIINVTQDEVTGEWIVTGVAKGNTTITFSFPGSERYASAENKTIEVTVSLNDVSITVNNKTLDLKVDENFTIVATTDPKDLKVEFIQDDSGVYTVDDKGVVTAVKEGTGSITVSVGDNKVYAKNSTVITVIVSAKPAPSINVVAENLTKYYGGPEQFSVNVTDEEGKGVSNKTVSITINGKSYNRTTDENGTARLNINLPSGDYAVNVTADDITVNATVTVLPTVSGSDVKKAYGQSASYNATFLNSVGEYLPKGTEVSFNINGNIQNANISDDNGLASLNINLPVGEYIVTATNPVTGENASNNITVTRADLNIEANAEPITVGDNATVIVTGFVNNGFASGTVTVTVGDKTYNGTIVPHLIGGAIAEIIVPGLTENVTADVNYLGDEYYNPANTTVNITVNPKGKENATISIDAPSEAPEGDNVTVTVTLPEDATGTVTIGNEAVPLVNGTASAVLTNLPAGNTTVPITYSGDEKYNAIETEINITVIEDKTINVKAPDVTKYYHGSERFVVNVTDSKGKALANKSVTITINGVTYNRTTNGNGTCSLALNLPVGVYNVTTTVENNTVNSVVTIFTTVNGTDVVKVFRNGTQYYATFLDGNGKYLAEGSAVRFNINGVMYDRKVTGDKGLAKLNINLQQGEYIITATNLNTTEMSSNNITVLSRIIENNDLTKFYRNASQYTVKIIGDDGKVVGAGVDVTFNVNGVLYTRQTNASGIAKLNINLPAGDYIITAECKECKVSNNIKVLPVLTAQDTVKKYGAPDQFVATLVDGQGNPYARQTVQFNINGVLYNRVTDSAGQAKLNIRLMPGQYIITSSYNGCNIANKITVQG